MRVRAPRRARLAGDVVAERVRLLGLPVQALRRDVIGVASVFADDAGQWAAQAAGEPDDVRLRVAGATPDRDSAEALAREVMALYTCGPAGGGGVRTSVTARLASDSCLVPRDWLRPGWRFVP